MGKQSQPPQPYQPGQGSGMSFGPKNQPKTWGGKFANAVTEFAGIKSPDAPDYVGAAEASAKGSRPDINTPFAGQQWTQGPDGSWTLNQGFSGAMGGLPDALGRQAMSAMGSDLDLSSLGQMVDPTQARQQAIDAAYGQAKSRLDPMWDQREEQLRTRLANQGLDPNSEAARNASSEMGQSRNDAYSSAMNSAIMQGTQAGESMFRQGLAGRQQMLAELLRKRGQPLDEMQALQRLMQMPTTPGGPDYLGAVTAQGNYDLGAWGQESQNRADLMKGAGEMGSSLMSLLPFMLSDERAKMNVIREASEAIPGVPWATWEYRHAPGIRHRGVIAQDLQAVEPGMVVEGSDGLLRVNYAALMEARNV